MIKNLNNCKKITELSSLAQETSLSPQEQITMKLHLMVCPACRAFNQNHHTLKKIIQGHKAADQHNTPLTPPPSAND